MDYPEWLAWVNRARETQDVRLLRRLAKIGRFRGFVTPDGRFPSDSGSGGYIVVFD